MKSVRRKIDSSTELISDPSLEFFQVLLHDVNFGRFKIGIADIITLIKVKITSIQRG
jgi:hypothetical protein